MTHLRISRSENSQTSRPAARYEERVALDPDACYDALRARDARFDGVFFVGVSTTGIYCRPICPARTPGRDALHVLPRRRRGRARRLPRVLPLPARARARQCAASMRSPRLVAPRAARIASGALNEARSTTRGAARRVRAPPAARDGARARRVAGRARADAPARAREAAAAGHGAVADRDRVRGRLRQRAPVQRACSPTRWAAPPSVLRAHPCRSDADAALDAAPRSTARRTTGTTLLAFLAARAIPGVEVVDGDSYRRAVVIGRRSGRRDRGQRDPRTRRALCSRSRSSLVPVLMPLVARVRRLFDLDARPRRDRARARPRSACSRRWIARAPRPARARRVRRLRGRDPARARPAGLGRRRRPRSPAGSSARFGAHDRRRRDGLDRTFPTRASAWLRRPTAIGEADRHARGRARRDHRSSRARSRAGASTRSAARDLERTRRRDRRSSAASGRGPRTTSRCARCTCPTRFRRRPGVEAGARCEGARRPRPAPRLATVARVRRDAPVLVGLIGSKGG